MSPEIERKGGGRPSREVFVLNPKTLGGKTDRPSANAHYLKWLTLPYIS